MNHLGTVVLETERLVLRPFVLEDAEAMHRNWAGDPEVTKFMTWPAHSGPDISRMVLTDWCSHYDNPEYYQWAIAWKERAGEPFGSISVVNIAAKTECVEIGYCIGRAFWGKGVMTEALNAVIDFFFDQVGALRVQARHDPRNPGSGRVMEKCGMKYEGMLRGADRNNQGVCDVIFRGILADDRKASGTLHENPFPILEFDENKTAKLNPVHFVDRKFDTDKMVITFFPEVIDKLVADGTVTLERTIGGENPLDVYRFADAPDVLVSLGQVGCACAGNLDLFHAMGIEKVMFCGGGGVLDKNIEVGQLLVVDGAIRDDGVSYHYCAPSRYIYTDPAVTEKIACRLDEENISYLRGLVWTTDAIFRETNDRIALRKKEGAKIVEMEQAGCIAVARFRGFDYGAIIYGGDDVASDEWSNRGWRSRDGIRYDLVQLCRKLVRQL